VAGTLLIHTVVVVGRPTTQYRLCIRSWGNCGCASTSVLADELHVLGQACWPSRARHELLRPPHILVSYPGYCWQLLNEHRLCQQRPTSESWLLLGGLCRVLMISGHFFEPPPRGHMCTTCRPCMVPTQYKLLDLYWLFARFIGQPCQAPLVFVCACVDACGTVRTLAACSTCAGAVLGSQPWRAAAWPAGAQSALTSTCAHKQE
jgi:hypothetical protein